ncbi:MAG: nitrilase-related carbon-nitrogen hydrolase [Phycisphaerales bacterium]|jgi:omega-amidase
MRAHLVQLDIVWEDREANFDRVLRLLDAVDVGQGDLVLLPEMFDSGFSLNTEATADDGATQAWLARLADDLGAVVMGGRTVGGCANGGCDKATNHAAVFGPSSDGGDPRLLCDYAKIHPFTYGREGERFVGGRHVETFRWQSGDESLVVCPTICYDLRFPELYRMGLEKGAEMFTCIANFPAARQSHWRTLAIARAIENQAFVLAVNRRGNDPHLAYAGGTIAVDARGEVIGELGDEEAVLTVDLDVAAFREWRAEFPAWKDGKLLARR